jgi:hypothetical protein
MSRQGIMLPRYAAFARDVEHARSVSPSLSAFTQTLRGDHGVVRRRSHARAELQGLYNLARDHFRLPDIPVYLPVRKKICVLGLARNPGGTPAEIRVYAIHGPSEKPYAPGSRGICASTPRPASWRP